MIRYKSITHERVEDAPFVGALICAISCHIGCKGCFNESIKSDPILCDSVTTILNHVQANPFNKGLILAGLEWSNQPTELITLIKEAHKRELPVIIYTGHSIDVFLRRVPDIKYYSDVLIKYGAYDESKLSMTHFNYGVKLASTNQHINSIAELLQVNYQQVI